MSGPDPADPDCFGSCDICTQQDRTRRLILWGGVALCALMVLAVLVTHIL